MNELIGKSKIIEDLEEAIKTLAEEDITVLIRGETGVGKEVVARLIHDGSKRKKVPLVTVNCSAITASLAESLLFGHEKGAFTSAHKEKEGFFEFADGGTIFLDEIGDLSLGMQLKLLRFLNGEDGTKREITPVGSKESKLVDVRVIMATNQNLEQLVKEGRFRKDFYYRISVFPVQVFPLRDRRDDIEVLVKHFLGKKKKIDFKAINKLKEHTWPGNVRELKTTIDRAVIMAKKRDSIQPEDITFSNFNFDSDLDSNAGSEELLRVLLGDGPLPQGITLKRVRDATEKVIIEKALRQSKGSIKKTAKFLDMERSNLHRKIKEREIDIKKIR